MDYIGIQEADDGDEVHVYVAFLTPLAGGPVTALEIALPSPSHDRAQLMLDKVSMDEHLYELTCSITRH